MARGTRKRPPDGFRTRLLTAGETPLYLDHLLRLDPRTRWLRFDHAMDQAAIQAHCLALQPRGTRVLGAFVEGVLRGAAKLSPCACGASPRTELAFSVEPDFQRCGIGYALISHALDLARPVPVVMFCREENKGMIALAQRAGACVAPQGKQLVCTLETAGTLWQDRLLAAGGYDPALLALTRGYV